MKKEYLLFIIVFLVFLFPKYTLKAQAPGGVSPNLRLWLKGNSGVTTSGSSVTAWADQSGGGFNATQALVAKQPTFTASSTLFNGNPSVDFDLTDDGMATTAGLTTRPYSFFVVYNSTSTSTGARRALQGAVGTNWLIGPYQNVASFHPGVPGGFVDPRNIPIGTKPTINTGISTTAASNNAFFYFDGKLVSAPTGVTAAGTPNIIHLGGSGANPPHTLGGSIAEVIAYTSEVSPAERNQIQSYLAIKYGITLDQTVATNYVNSSGAILYPSATIHNGFTKDVVGIAKDDGSGLNQTKSKSVNTASVLEIESPAVLNNGDYFISGDNGANIDLRSSDAPGGYGQRLQRVWRVSKSANPTTVTIRMFVGDIPELMANPDLANVALLKNSSNSFAGATPITGATVVGSFNDTLEFTGVSFNNGDYFTLSLGIPPPMIADFEYWYGVPRWDSAYRTPQKLHFTGVSATEYATYIIDMPANPGFTPITGTVAPKGSKIIDMTSFISAITVEPANTILNRGLRIQVNGRMGAYYSNEQFNNYGTFPLRGPNALGTSFIIPGQNTFQNGSSYANAKSLFAVTATENGTVVTITPSEAIIGHGANVPFTITLNKGQSYSADAVARNGNHLGGSIVISTLPVVITYSDDLLLYGTAADNAGDQLVPISKFGLEFAHIRANVTSTGEYAYIFGSENGTTVTVFDGTTTTTLVVDKGTFVKHLMPTTGLIASIKADKPVMVYKIGGVNQELGGGVLTPIADCKGTNSIAFQYPTVSTFVAFSFVAPDAIVGSFLLNGSNSIITAADFVSIPGIPGWKYARKTVTGIFPNGSVVSIDNTLGKFYFYQNMYSGGGGDYSNFSDFGNVVTFPTATHTCGSNTITLNNGAIPFNITINGYSWTGPNSFTSSSPNPVLTNPTAVNVGTYVLTVTDENLCTYTENLEVNLPIDSIVLTPTPSSPCVGSTMQFTSTAVPVEAIPASISWTGPNGFTSTQANFEITGITAAHAGTYICTYTDKYGCQVTNSVTIAVSPAVLASFTIAGEHRLSCASPNTTLSVTGFTAGLQYDTYQPYDASSLFASTDFTVIADGFYNEQPTNSGVVPQMNLAGLTGITGASQRYGVKYRGFIDIATAGNYTFYTNSVDGSNLYIDGSLLVSNDGSHTATELASVATTLSVGRHAIEVNYFKSSVGASLLSVSYAGPSIPKQVIPAAILSHAAGAAPALTYLWSPGGETTSSINVTTPGTYSVTGSNGGCSSVVNFIVEGIDSYDYSDMATPWPVAQAKVLSCIVAGVPSGSNGAVWAGAGVSTEPTALRNATATADTFDDGLIRPTSSTNTFDIILNSNTSGTTVHYGLWFDWNNNGNFADDVDGNGDPAFYSGSGVTASPVTVSVPVIPPVGASGLYTTRLIVADIPVVFTGFDDIFDNGEVEDYTSVLLLSGTVFADANGLNGSPANTVDGTGTNAGGLTAILVNSAGNVVANAIVAANGAYNFVSPAPDTYTIVLSTTAGTVGSPPPVPSLPAGWLNTGENLGAAAGNDGTVNGILTNVVVSVANVTNANFGINRPPTANPVASCQVDPGGTTQVNVPILTGSDPEDGIYNGSSSTNTITIVTLPANGVLFYNAVVVTAGQVIVNYNPNLLTLDPDAGADVVTFTFNELDASGTPSLPATVTVSLAYAGADQSANVGGSATMAAIGTGTWTADPGNPGTAIITTPNSPTTTITGFSVIGVYNFIWTSSNGCTDSALVFVPTATPIVANDDTGAAVNGASGGTSFANVLINDTLNGNPVVATDVTTTFVSSTNPGITLVGTSVMVAPGTPSGNYALEYQICEIANPTNCDTAIVTVFVTLGAIIANDDTGTPVNGSTGGTGFTNVLINDTLNGNPVVATDVNTTFVSSTHAGITLVGTDVMVAAGTPAGTYTLVYQICEILNPTNCDTATVTITVTAAAIIANDDTGTPVNGSTGGTGFTNVLINDTLNGNPVVATDVNTTFVSSTNAGVTLVGTDVMVAAGTPAGTYTLVYQICEILNPTNCDTATVTLTVTAAAIVANDDTGTPVNGSTGGTGFTNVLINDTLNGNPVVATDVNTTFVSSTNAGVTLVGTDVMVAAGTPAGTYTLVYQICEILNPTNCDTATVTITVTAAAIVANDDTGTPVNGSTGGTGFTNVLINDTLNGNPVVATDVNTTFVSSTHAGITLVGTDVMVAAGTPAGTYTLVYQICEILNPTNCDTATVTITVTAAAIVANDDTGTPVNGSTGGTGFTNVLINDTLNGNPVVATDVNTTFVSSTNAGITLVGTDVMVAPGTPAGTYTLVYQICEILNPTNCDTATVTITVTAAAIVANDDTGTPVNGSTGGTGFTNVLINDTLNGNPVVATDVNPTFVSSTHAGITLVGTDVMVAPGTPAGTYTLVYQICEILNPTNCDTATVTITVTAAAIVANDDTGTSVNGSTGGTGFTNVLINDTLNGNPVVATDVNTTFVSSTNAGITLVGTDVMVAAGTPAGTYTLVYQICEILNPTNCDTATVTITVTAAAIVANDDTGTPVNGSTGGTGFSNVLINDTLNGNPVVATDVNTTFVSSTNAGVTLVGTDVIVAAGTPAGTYTLVYQICEILNPTNCDTATVTITVTAAAIVANDDTGTPVNGSTGGTGFTNVLINDTLNGNPVVATDVNTTFVSSTHAGITLVGTDVMVAAGTPAGTYTLVYQICEILNPTNCDTATVTITVTAPVIIANDDTGTPVNGSTGGTGFTNVLINDTLNGNPVVATDVNTTFVSSTHAGITLVGTDVMVAAGTPAGTYTLVYQICEILNPTNCDMATVTITVTAAAIVANDDTGTPVNGSTGGTGFTNVLINDTLNGNPVVATDVNTTFVSSTHAGVTLVGTDVMVAAGTPAGTYTLVYQICEILNPTNCDTATVTITVTAAAIVANDDTGTPVNGSTGGTGFTNVLINDTLNGNPVVATDVNTTFVSSTHAGVTLVGTDVMVAAGTPAGTYTLVYQICEILNPTNCDTATVTITVTAAAIVANDDTGTPVNGSTGGTGFTNVLINDTLNGNPVVATDVNTTFVSSTHAGITLVGTDVMVAAGTPAGTYTLVYQICEILNPTNCDTATVTIIVMPNAPSIAIIKTATFNDENGDGYAQAGETITYNFTITNTGDVPLTNINITDPLPGVVITGGPISLAVGEQDTTSFIGSYAITQADINNGGVSNQATVNGTSPGGVIVGDESDDSNNAEDDPTVLSLSGCVIEVFNAVSPNSDSNNDVFYVRGLECYPDNTVEIYNRWGVLVFERDHYNNTDRAFKGISEGRVTVNKSEELPVGTYFYILKFKDNNASVHEKSGYLYINRK